MSGKNDVSEPFVDSVPDTSAVRNRYFVFLRYGWKKFPWMIDFDGLAGAARGVAMAPPVAGPRVLDAENPRSHG